MLHNASLAHETKSSQAKYMQPTIKRGRMKSYAIQMDPCVYVVQINESGLVSSPSHNSCIIIDLSDLWDFVPRCIVGLQLLRLLAGHHHTTVYLKCTAVLAHQPHQERAKSIWWLPKGNKSIFRHSSESRAGSLDSTFHEQSIHMAGAIEPDAKTTEGSRSCRIFYF